MKTQSLSVKRRPSRKGAVRTLMANVARNRKRHRASTSADPRDFEGDVPNVGVARALVVILSIHVVAIAGIFIHSRWIDVGGKAESATEAAVLVEPKPLGAIGTGDPDAGLDLPKISSGDSLYTVGAGDTYETIAGRFRIEEDRLRVLNDNLPLRPGRVLKVPAQKITAVEPPELAELRDGRPVVEDSAAGLPDLPGMIPTKAARALDAGAAPEPTPSPSAASGGSGRVHVVRSGETPWAIAQKHGVTVDALMKANGINDPRRLRIDMTLKIPQSSTP